MLQLAEPVKGDWASKCLADLKELKISDSFDEIRIMKKKQFSTILKSRISENALVYLTKKIKSKGSEILYQNIELADYLQPINPMSIEQKQRLFAIRNRMVQIPDNFPKSETKTKCFCGDIEDMKHIFTCNILNNGINQSEKYENIFNGTISQQTKIFHKFEENMENRKTLIKEMEMPCDPGCDPLSSIVLQIDCNGYKINK